MITRLSARISRIEKSFTPQADLRTQHLAHVLWERRQRRLKAQGMPFETVSLNIRRVHICRLLKRCECAVRNAWPVGSENRDQT